MDHLYQEYFGLTQAPFNVTPDPFFLYLSASHREALAQLSYGVNARKGFVVLTGEVGTGKTTLVHSLLHDLGDETQTALVFSAIVSPVDLLRYICEEFRLVEPKQPCTDVHEYLILLNEFLLEKYRNGENCALIIDEAQNLSPDVLESIRLLSNFETSKDKLLQIVLVGQPELAVRLNSRELTQLKQRITLRHHLRPLNLSECREYVSTRLRIAGGDAAIFSQSALESIYQYSGGVPRLINVLGDNALLTSYALEKKSVDDLVIREVARDLSLPMEHVPFVEPQRAVPTMGLNGSSSKASDLKPGKLISPGFLPQTQSAIGDGRVSVPSGGEGTVPTGVFETLQAELTEAMGPMANIVIEDCIRKLGHSFKAFPRKNWPMLIESLSREILDHSMRREFQQSLARRLVELPASRKF